MWTAKNVLITTGISLGTFIVGSAAKYGFGKAKDAVNRTRDERKAKEAADAAKAAADAAKAAEGAAS